MSLLWAVTAGYCVADVIIIESNLNLGHQKEGSTDISPAQGFFLSKGSFSCHYCLFEIQGVTILIVTATAVCNIPSVHFDWFQILNK